MLASAMSSSRSGARLHHSESRCEWISASSPSIRQYAARASASTPSGTVVSTPARGSSKSVPNAHWESSITVWWSSSPSYAESWNLLSVVTIVEILSGPPRSCSSEERSGGGEELRGECSHVGDVVGDVVERRVAIDLVTTRREQ